MKPRVVLLLVLALGLLIAPRAAARKDVIE
jgi:hypothetical protein